MAAERTDTHAPEIEWDSLAPGGEVSATVLMASGFALARGSTVRERYRVVRALGEGMMGQVLAVQLLGHADEQTYALKMVARRGDDANDDEAASQAAAYAALLRQEAAKQDIVQRHGIAVARLFALVQLDDGAIGMRMECARGRSLESWLDQDRETAGAAPDVFRAVSVVRKLVSQLRRLHEIVDPGSPQGFVHCDIKPGNVFVDDADANDLQVTLLDFGVATAGQALAHGLASRPHSRHTFIMQETGGTLGYAPAGHFTRKATPLSDIFASLVILFELVTLGLPWPLADTGDAYDDVIDIERRMHTPPRSVRAARPSVSSRDATVLDDFFRREFEALNRLNEEISQQADGGATSAQRSATTQLARQYQTKLDDLCAHFAHRAVRPSHAKEPTRIQRVVVLGESGPHEPAKASPDVAHVAPSKRAGLVVVNAAPSANADTTGALPLMRSVTQKAETPARSKPDVPPPASAPAKKPDAAKSNAQNAAPARSPAPGVHAASSNSQPAVPLVSNKLAVRSDRAIATVGRPDRRLLWGIVPLAIVLLGIAGVALLRSRPVASAGALQTVCFAPHAGVRVVARGGSLAQEVTVCTVVSAPAPGGFTGIGSLAPEVLRARANFACVGGAGPLDVSVEHADGARVALSTFRCRTR